MATTKFDRIVNALNEKHNGSFFNITWYSDVDLLKEFKESYTVKKITTSTVRKGINYSSMKAVKQAEKEKIQKAMSDPTNAKEYAQMVQNRDRELPWGHWMVNYEGLIIEHTNKAGEYNRYVRLYSSPNKPKIHYMVNGVVKTRQEVEAMGIVKPSYWAKGNEPLTAFTIKVDNIVNIF